MAIFEIEREITDIDNDYSAITKVQYNANQLRSQQMIATGFNNRGLVLLEIQFAHIPATFAGSGAGEYELIGDIEVTLYEGTQGAHTPIVGSRWESTGLVGASSAISASPFLVPHGGSYVWVNPYRDELEASEEVISLLDLNSPRTKFFEGVMTTGSLYMEAYIEQAKTAVTSGGVAATFNHTLRWRARFLELDQ